VFDYFSFAYRLGVLENSSVAPKQTPRDLGVVTQQNLMSAFALPAQPVDATQALNLSAGVSNCKVSRGRSFS